MPAPPKNATCHTVAAIALAAAATIALLWYAGEQASSVQAMAVLPRPELSADRDVAPCPWSSTTPVTTVLTNQPYTWTIPLHDVTVTFRFNTLPGPKAAIMSFTPQCEGIEIDPFLTTSYYFRLEGVFDDGAAVSLNDYEIALHYDPAYLGGAEEHTLQFYYYFEAPPPLDDWLLQDSTVDVAHDTAACTTRQTGLFALGGNDTERVYLPLVLRDSAH